MESQLQNPEFRINPENFHQWMSRHWTMVDHSSPHEHKLLVRAQDDY